jgi:hypothetical protein
MATRFRCKMGPFRVVVQDLFDKVGTTIHVGHNVGTQILHVVNYNLYKVNY